MSFSRNSEASPIMTSRTYTKSGIGGIGNFHISSGAKPIPIEPRINVIQTSEVFSTGIGGIGNIRLSRGHTLITPEEILSRKMIRRDSAAQSYHHGIGGAGNRTSLYTADDSMSASPSLSGSSNRWTRRLRGADRLKEKFESSKTSLLQASQRASAYSVSLSSSASLDNA